MVSKLKGVQITGMASVVPSGVMHIEKDPSLSGVPAARLERLKQDIGLKARHITVKDECASDLCEHAANYLLSKLDYSPSTVDCLIMVTQTPDYFQPATSCVLHGRLGLTKDCAALDINLGCSGYVYGLWLSSMMISGGDCKRVLLLAGDTLSRCVSSEDSAVAPLFGDAGSATILESSQLGHQINFALHSDGKGYQHLIVSAGAFRKKSPKTDAEMSESEISNRVGEEYLYMNGAEIFNFSIREVPPLVEEILTISGWPKDEVDSYIFHQANKFILTNIARKLQIPIEKAPYNVFEKFGNQSSASIPATICHNLSPVVSSKSINVVLAGFGAGLSWAACALPLGPLECSPVLVLD